MVRTYTSILSTDTLKLLRDYSWTVKKQQMQDLASMLGGPQLGGLHRDRMESNQRFNQQQQINAILSDWFDLGMSAMSEMEALEKLITVLNDNNIALHPLAQDLQKVHF